LADDKEPNESDPAVDSSTGLVDKLTWFIRLILVVLLLLVFFGLFISAWGLAIYGAIHLLHGVTATSLIFFAIVLTIGCLFSLVRAILNLLFWPVLLGTTTYGAFHLFDGIISTPLLILALILTFFALFCAAIFGI
jgi:hypothetical protein